MLKGGKNNFEGNVYALNPTTGVFGPICDDFWSMKDVSYTNVENPWYSFSSKSQRVFVPNFGSEAYIDKTKLKPFNILREVL